MKKKLLHIMMGTHNPDLQKGFDSVFDCYHFDWTIFGENSPILQFEVLKKFYEFSPDIVFIHTQSGSVILNETLSIMSNKSSVFSWTGDVRHPLPNHYIEQGRLITSTLFTNMNDVEYMKSFGVNADFLQVGFDENYFNPIGRISKTYPDIIFLGSNYTDKFPLSDLRYRMVYRLRQEFGANFGLYGANWNSLQNGFINNYEQEGMAYRSCKIAINLSHFAYKRYSSDRLFRMLGSGAFCLTHHYPEIEVDFNVGNDLAVWNDLDDLIEKINYYLHNEKERNRIAMNGCYNARMNFTWKKFAENFNKIIDKKQIKNEQPVSLG